MIVQGSNLTVQLAEEKTVAWGLELGKRCSVMNVGPSIFIELSNIHQKNTWKRKVGEFVLVSPFSKRLFPVKMLAFQRYIPQPKQMKHGRPVSPFIG